jgi:heterodisulfide reductase subunit A-like polyferredoxin
MTKKDFELIARAIRDARPIRKLDELTSQAARNAVIGANSALDSAAHNLADAIQVSHPRFDKHRFLKACESAY